MNRQLDELKKDVIGLCGISKSNPHSPGCICDGCRYSKICYGGYMRGCNSHNVVGVEGRSNTFCFIDMVQGAMINE